VVPSYGSIETIAGGRRILPEKKNSQSCQYLSISNLICASPSMLKRPGGLKEPYKRITVQLAEPQEIAAGVMDMDVNF
jgi:hypothetical protein